MEFSFNPELHSAYGLGEDWNFWGITNHPNITLHSAYGLGEDWNRAKKLEEIAIERCTQPTGWVRIGTTSIRSILAQWIALHSAYGLGEDWNYIRSQFCSHRSQLHSAYGLGEDWNCYSEYLRD